MKEPIDISFSEFDGEKVIKRDYTVTMDDGEKAYNLARLATSQREKFANKQNHMLTMISEENKRLKASNNYWIDLCTEMNAFLKSIEDSNKKYGIFFRLWFVFGGWKILKREITEQPEETD